MGGPPGGPVVLVNDGSEIRLYFYDIVVDIRISSLPFIFKAF